MNKKQYSGFSLIELMIAIMIIAILSAIAIPNYQSYMRRATCEDAKATLIGAANVMERFRAQNNTYVNTVLGDYAASPVDGASKQFTIALTNADCTAAHNQAASYCLVATPTATSRLNGRGTLTLTSAGVRGATGDLANPPNDDPVAQNVWQNRCSGL